MNKRKLKALQVPILVTTGMILLWIYFDSQAAKAAKAAHDSGAT
jgi:hypothetical protein